MIKYNTMNYILLNNDTYIYVSCRGFFILCVLLVQTWTIILKEIEYLNFFKHVNRIIKNNITYFIVLRMVTV